MQTYDKTDEIRHDDVQTQRSTSRPGRTGIHQYGTVCGTVQRERIYVPMHVRYDPPPCKDLCRSEDVPTAATAVACCGSSHGPPMYLPYSIARRSIPDGRPTAPRQTTQQPTHQPTCTLANDTGNQPYMRRAATAHRTQASYRGTPLQISTRRHIGRASKACSPACLRRAPPART